MLKFEKGNLPLKPADVKNAHRLTLQDIDVPIAIFYELTNGDTIVHYNDSVLKYESITGESFRTQIVAHQISNR